MTMCAKLQSEAEDHCPCSKCTDDGVSSRACVVRALDTPKLSCHAHSFPANSLCGLILLVTAVRIITFTDGRRNTTVTAHNLNLPCDIIVATCPPIVPVVPDLSFLGAKSLLRVAPIGLDAVGAAIFQAAEALTILPPVLHQDAASEV
eukprot:CAMPEP_0194480560 /NCGR_PEP_ID=MMETSP0253-20130528/3314_1 /TAXON_ID=2966 /ORGANISM="Noctiluca scintillans" /LENGTH=147 /DNA_ID=CAMNT_0039319957 /DNA_START=157 /DNA_END=600 /DNA_ORIENTATION=-